MLPPGLVWVGTALWLPGMNPSMSHIPGAGSTRIYPRSCLKQDFPWCCPHLLRPSLSHLSVLEHLPGLTAQGCSSLSGLLQCNFTWTIHPHLHPPPRERGVEIL